MCLRGDFHRGLATDERLTLSIGVQDWKQKAKGETTPDTILPLCFWQQQMQCDQLPLAPVDMFFLRRWAAVMRIKTNPSFLLILLWSWFRHNYEKSNRHGQEHYMCHSCYLQYLQSYPIYSESLINIC